MEETSNFNAAASPSMSDVDDGEEVVSPKLQISFLLTECHLPFPFLKPSIKLLLPLRLEQDLNP